MKNTYQRELHREQLLLSRKLLEVRLLLVDLKQAMERDGFRPDLIKKIELKVKP